MSNPIIEVKNLSKSYRLGYVGAGTLREEMENLWKSFRRGQKQPQKTKNTVWALNNISFNVDPGEIIGVIGRNGAGKSTLLKILSRVTEPTSGEAIIRGRIASLLEVGTGFHPELSGRDNTFLSGSILGMKRDEIHRKFDEIVAFAELEDFIDTPVKRYSSGMYVRLAFAVAAHLDPEILFVDEVLAVGDSQFQRKCIEKMQKLTRSGKTILFVSHNLYLIRTLCSRTLVMKNGEIIFNGSAEGGLAQYQISLAKFEQNSEHDCVESDLLRLTDLRINGEANSKLIVNGSIRLELSWTVTVKKAGKAYLGVSIKSTSGDYISGLSSFLEEKVFDFTPGEYRCGISIENLDLAAGAYSIGLAVMDENGIGRHLHLSSACNLTVDRKDSFAGFVGLQHNWQHERLNSSHK